MEHFVSAIILMGGSGIRVDSPLPKQFHLLGKKPVYEQTVRIFQESGLFQEIVLVVHPDWVERVQIPGCTTLPGGATRQASSFAGLRGCNKACDFVMIHDAVRPFVSLDILRKNLELVVEHQAVDTCIPSADTIVQVKGRTIQSIPPRSEFWLGQTPQTFAYPLITKAHQETKRTNASDDCQLVLDLGHPIVIVEGSPENFKITNDGDLKRAQRIVAAAPDLKHKSK